MAASRVFGFIAKEVREMMPPTVFFAVGFSVVVLRGHLTTEQFGLQPFNFMVAATSALMVSKSSLLANAMTPLRRFDASPRIVPILVTTLVYFTVLLIIRILQQVVEYWMAGGSRSVTAQFIQGGFARRHFAVIQIWIFALFLIYTTAV